jgi:hypothetical protein
VTTDKLQKLLVTVNAMLNASRHPTMDGSHYTKPIELLREDRKLLINAHLELEELKKYIKELEELKLN